MSDVRFFLSQAIENRLRQVCDQTINQLHPSHFPNCKDFVSEVQNKLTGKSPADLRSFYSSALETEGDSDCFAGLRRIALGQLVSLKSHPVAVEEFFQRLLLTKSDSNERLRLLSERYKWPISFTIDSEKPVQEYVLQRLMVNDRPSSTAWLRNEDILLRLNLVSLQAALAKDLRFLDALNYYSELMPSKLDSDCGCLVVSFLALYARALASWL